MNDKEPRQVTVISGKGGTGKTSLIAALAYLLKDKAVLADADVDAADLYLIYNPELSEDFDYYGLKKASIDFDICTECMKCYESCRFNAIDENLNINPFLCEGCALCYHICPVSAIEMEDRISGQYFVSDTRIGKMIHAKLKPGEESSGLLVAEVRKKAREIAKQENKQLILIDGSPGIGCPVISSLTGTDLAIVVSEPTLSGKHDLERILELLKQFNIPGFIVINKYDINRNIGKQIELGYGEEFPVLCNLGFHKAFTQAMIQEQSIIEYTNENNDKKLEEIKQQIRDMANFIVNKLQIE